MHIVAVLFRKSHNVQSPAFRTDHRRAGDSDFWDDGALTASEIGIWHGRNSVRSVGEINRPEWVRCHPICVEGIYRVVFSGDIDHIVGSAGDRHIRDVKRLGVG